MTFLHPAVLLLIPPLLVGVVLLERRVAAPPRRRLARTAVRGLVLSLLVAAFAAPLRDGWRATGRRLVVAVDRSAALDVHGRREALELARSAAAEATREGAAVTLLGFADRAAAPWTLGDTWPRGPAGPWPEPPAAMAGSPVPEPVPEAEAAPGPRIDSGPGPERAARARPAAALAAAELAFGPHERGTVLLLASGRGTPDGLETAALSLAAAGIRLRAAALPREAPPPLPRSAVVALDLPDTARGAFDVTAAVRGPGALAVELLVDGQSFGTERRDATEPGPRTVSFPGLDLAPGIHEVALVVRGEGTPAALDRRLVVVEAPPRILACVEQPETSGVRRALSAQGFQVVAVPAAALPAALAGEGPPPDALVLDAATARSLPPGLQREIAARVEQGLGLFLEAGASEEAWTALAGSPLGRLLPVTPEPPPPEPPPEPRPPEPTPPGPPPPSVDPRKEDDTPGLRAERRPDEALPISLMLVLDRSGSMHAGGKLAMAIEGARRAAAALSPADRVAVVTFAEESTLDIPPTPVRRIRNLSLRLAMLQPGGNTDIFGALARATAVLEGEQAPIRHLILLTDGEQNMTGALFSPLMRRMTAAGITLTALGLGRDHDEFLLKRLVQFSARGRYRAVDGPAQLPTILTRDTQRVVESRDREAQAMARIEDPNRPPTTEPPQPPPEAPPRPPGPEPTPPETAPPPPRAPDRPALAPLHLLRPHEATRGLEPDAMPVVGAPRRATPRHGAPLLLVRGDGEPVLAARRWGLGRTMVWTLPPETEGVAAWPDLGRVFVQGVRSVRAPKGAFDRAPTGRIVRAAGGEHLVLDPAPPGRDAAPVRVTWTDPSGARDLGTFLPGQDVALPAGDPGAAVVVRLVSTSVESPPAAPPLTYLAGLPADVAPRAGDAAALAAALGPAALSTLGPLLPPPGRRPDPTPLWAPLLALALLLLPLDAGLHRRAGGRTPGPVPAPEPTP